MHQLLTVHGYLLICYTRRVSAAARGSAGEPAGEQGARHRPAHQPARHVRGNVRDIERARWRAASRLQAHGRRTLVSACVVI